MNRNLAFTAAALFLWGFGEGMFYNFVPIYLSGEFALSESQVGLALGAMGFFMALMHIPGGRIADKAGRRPLLVIAWSMGLFATLTMALSTRLPFYLIGLFAYGMTAFVSSPLSSYVTAAPSKWELGKKLALISASFSIGMALGPVTGGWVSEAYGMRSIYFMAAGVFVISTALITRIAPQPLDSHDPSTPPLSLWSNRRFLSFLAVISFAAFAMYLAQPLTPNFLKDIRRLSLTETGWAFSAGALGNALLTVAVSQFKPRHGFILGQFCVAIFAALMWMGSGLPAFMLAYFLLGGFRAARPMAQAQARELVHPSQMGLMYGTIETAYSIVFIAVPPLAGILFERDPFLIYPLAFALILISAALSFITRLKPANL
ncbi:MAG: hypothetical protein Fur002_10660 [Anaerolineales bacterium]